MSLIEVKIYVWPHYNLLKLNIIEIDAKKLKFRNSIMRISQNN